MKNRIPKQILAGLLSLLPLSGTLALPVCNICGLASISASADETDTSFHVGIANSALPSGVISVGGSFNVHGEIQTDHQIAAVCGGIYSADGSEVFCFLEDHPYSFSYELQPVFNCAQVFGTLPPGRYLYKIEITDPYGYSAVAAESYFSVLGNSALTSEIYISRESMPADMIPTGSNVVVRGQISSTFGLAGVWGGVYNMDGTPTDVYFEDHPNTSVYDLSDAFAAQLSFADLPAGDYIYRISASDAYGKTETLIDKAFIIADGDAAPSDIQLFSPFYPTSVIAKGWRFTVSGTVSSVYPLQSVTFGIYNAEDTSQPYDNSIGSTQYPDPDATTFELYSFDEEAAFGNLPEGEYVYIVTATDSRGFTKELVNSAFSVRSMANPPDAQQILMNGMDVSAYQGNIDWEQVYADGIDFAILRAGVTPDENAYYYQDGYFNTYYQAARKAGIKLGAYLYTSAITKSEMKYDIECLLRTLNGRYLDLPVFIDVETEKRQTRVGKEALTEVLCYGCELLREHGYRPGIYSGYYWFNNSMNSDILRELGVELWLAYWPNDPTQLNFSKYCVTWQFSATGAVSGIIGNVDRDYRYAALSDERHTISTDITGYGIAIVNKSEAAYGERVSVTLMPDYGFHLKSVQCGGRDAVLCTDGFYSFPMPDADVTIKIEFEPDEGYTPPEAPAVTTAPAPAETEPAAAVTEKTEDVSTEETETTTATESETDSATTVTETTVPSDETSENPAETEEQTELTEPADGETTETTAAEESEPQGTDLPETGCNDPSDLLAAVSALMMTGTGLCTVIRRRKR